MTTGYPHPTSMAFVRPPQPMNDYQPNLQQLGLNFQLLHNGALCRLGTQRRANMAISFAKNSAYIAELYMRKSIQFVRLSNVRVAVDDACVLRKYLYY